MKEYSKLESIYNTYVDDLYSYGVYLGFDCYIVMDAIHDVFFNLCSNKEVLHNVENIKFYLIRSLKNNLINVHKSTKKTVSLNYVEDPEDKSFNVEDVLISEEKAAKVNKNINSMLDSLTNKQKEIIYLRYILEYDYNDIADLLNITQGSCRKLVHKAIQQLRKKVQE